MQQAATRIAAPSSSRASSSSPAAARFDAMTGKVLAGPAQADLAPVPVKVSGQDVVAG